MRQQRKQILVIEAIIEDLKTKRELFARISKICKPDAILSTNSSNIVSSKLADVTEHSERLLNIHYFNPALVMKLVEIVKGPHTSDETAETARQFAIDTGKTPIVLHKEVPGFVVNRINAAVVHEALSLLERGSCFRGRYRYRLRKGAELSDGTVPSDGSYRNRCKLLCTCRPLCREP